MPNSRPQGSQGRSVETPSRQNRTHVRKMRSLPLPPSLSLPPSLPPSLRLPAFLSLPPSFSPSICMSEEHARSLSSSLHLSRESAFCLSLSHVRTLTLSLSRSLNKNLPQERYMRLRYTRTGWLTRLSVSLGSIWPCLLVPPHRRTTLAGPMSAASRTSPCSSSRRAQSVYHAVYQCCPHPRAPTLAPLPTTALVPPRSGRRHCGDSAPWLKRHTHPCRSLRLLPCPPWPLRLQCTSNPPPPPGRL